MSEIFENAQTNSAMKPPPAQQDLIDPIVFFRPIKMPPPPAGYTYGIEFFEEIPAGEQEITPEETLVLPDIIKVPEPTETLPSEIMPMMPSAITPMTPLTSIPEPSKFSFAYLYRTEISAPTVLPQAPSRKAKPTPYDVAQELIRREPLVCVGNALYRFDGRVYRLLKDQDLSRFIMERCRGAVAEVGDASFIDRVYKVLFSEPTISQKPVEPEADLLVLEDGVLNTKTWELLPHNARLFATNLIHASYRNGRQSGCPNFDNFVNCIAGGDALLSQRIWESVGYLLSPDMKGKCFIVLQGVADSGKTLLGNFIRRCFDETDVTSLDINAFAKNFALADIIGKRLCTDLDLPGAVLNTQAVSFLKKLTGGDALSTDVKYMPRVTFLNTAKLLFATNHPILTAQADQAFLRRLIVIPFRFSVRPELRNDDLLQLLECERDAVVVKALGYYARLLENHYIFSGDFPPNQVCERASGTSADLSSAVATFLLTCCDQDPTAWTSTRDLFSAFAEDFPGVGEYMTFSSAITTFRLPNVQKTRKRPIGETNPVSGFQGLKLKGDLR